MSTEVLVKKLNKEVRDLRGEMNRMRKVLFQVVLDREGEYRKSFVQKVLRREKEKSLFRYTTKAGFLRYVRTK